VPVAVDVRVVAATHRQQPDRARGGPLRDDLYARLAGLTVTLPPLAERREDIGLLVASLLARIAGERAAGLRLQEPAARALFAYGWPLNVRELEQALERAVAVCPDQLIRLDHLPEPVRAAGDDSAGADARQQARLTALLRKHRGNVTEVAREIGLSRAYTHRLIKRYAIDVDALRGR
jgi:transcriptional regulator of acetoin/glycerol metabolism